MSSKVSLIVALVVGVAIVALLVFSRARRPAKPEASAPTDKPTGRRGPGGRGFPDLSAFMRKQPPPAEQLERMVPKARITVDGLPGSTVDARIEGVLGSITARQGPDAPARDPNKCLSIAGIVIESSKRPTMVAGRRLCGKSRLTSASARAYSIDGTCNGDLWTPRP